METKPLDVETKPIPVASAPNNWYMLTGLLLGLALGLVFSLLVFPFTNTEALPSELSMENRAEYRLMIAQSFAAQPNLERANSRLALLDDTNPADALLAQAQELLATGGTEEDARALAYLAAMLSTLPPTSP